MKKKYLSPYLLYGALLLFIFYGCSAYPRPSQETTTLEGKRGTAESQGIKTKEPIISQLSTVTKSSTKNPYVSFKCTNISAVPLLNQGENLLFVDRAEGVWRIIATDDHTEKTVAEIKSDNIVSNFALSNDGNQLAYEDGPFTKREFIVLNLTDGKKTSFTLNIGEKWIGIKGWTKDNRVTIELSYDEIPDQGLFIRNLLLDPITGRTENTQERYDLPGYFRVEGAFFTGIPAIDPTEKRALYERWVGEGKVSTKATFINLVSKQFLWENSNSYSGEPDWADDGSRVVLGSLLGNDPYLKILSLSKEGKVSELSHQPLFHYDYMFRYFDISPNNRYIHFTNWKSITSGPGYILDTQEDQFLEICGYTGEFIRGSWLTKQNFLTYQTQNGEEVQYWVLNVQNGQSRSLIRGKNITFLGFSTSHLAK